MMVVDFQVALAADFQIEQSMLREQLDHMIKKRQASADARTAIAIEVDLNPHVSLFRLALNSRLADSVLFFHYQRYLFVRRVCQKPAREQGQRSPTHTSAAIQQFAARS